jgi:hypothetical protein
VVIPYPAPVTSLRDDSALCRGIRLWNVLRSAARSFISILTLKREAGLPKLPRGELSEFMFAFFFALITDPDDILCTYMKIQNGTRIYNRRKNLKINKSKEMFDCKFVDFFFEIIQKKSKMSP